MRKGHASAVACILTPAVACILLAACTGGSPAADGPVISVVDGVTFVDNPGLRLADSTAWSVDPEPLVQIGVVEGAEEYMIGQLAGMLRRADGTILIADAIAHTVRVYDERGTFVRSVGRAGEGPGEYGWLTQIMPYTADSIVVMDNENSRVNVLDPQLEFVRRYRPQLRDTRAPAGMTSHRLVSFFADGSALMSDYIDTCGPARSHGFCEDSVSYVRTREDTVLATFGTFVYGRTEARRVERGFATAWTEPHPQPFRTIRGNRFYHADSKRFAVEVYGADGSLERVMRVRAEPPEVSRDEALFVHDMSAEQQADPRRRRAYEVYRDARGSATLPDTLPWFSGMLVDDTDHVWLREYRPGLPAPDEGTRWFVLDPEGKLRYSVRLPADMLVSTHPLARLRPQIGNDFILAATRDGDGVERVVLHRLSRARAADTP